MPFAPKDMLFKTVDVEFNFPNDAVKYGNSNLATLSVTFNEYFTTSTLRVVLASEESMDPPCCDSSLLTWSSFAVASDG